MARWQRARRKGCARESLEFLKRDAVVYAIERGPCNMFERELEDRRGFRESGRACAFFTRLKRWFVEVGA
jgi:hypothetical protein